MLVILGGARNVGPYHSRSIAAISTAQAVKEPYTVHIWRSV